MTRRIANLKIAHELLPDLLHLPIGTKVVGVEQDPKSDLLNVTVTHGHLKEVADGEPIPATLPAFTSVAQPPVARFDGWGAQDDGNSKRTPGSPASQNLPSNAPPTDGPIPANKPGPASPPLPVVTHSPPIPAPAVHPPTAPIVPPRMATHDGPTVTSAPIQHPPSVTGH